MSEEDAVDVEHDPLLNAIESPDAHDNLIGYMREGETASEALERLLFSLPSFAQLECRECGRDLAPLYENDWIAWRLRVESSDFRRTDLYCDLVCLADSLDAELQVPVTDGDLYD